MARASTKSQGEDFHVQVPADLKAAFEAAAKTVARPATEIIIDLMRDFVDERQEPDPGYDEWFRAKIQESIDDPRPNISHDEVMRRTHAIIDAIVADNSKS